MHTRHQLARLLTVCATLTVLALAASAAPVLAADGVRRGATYADGPDNRYLLGGDWLFRFDREDLGLVQGFQHQETTDGWSRTTVPNAWNAGDNSAESMSGTIGYYRKDFRLPDPRSRMSWILRFESVNYRTKVWVNGKRIGRNTGAYLPFELRIPNRVLKRNGVNRLVMRVDNRRRPSDFPPSGINSAGDPTGGWWNYGGLLREVYLKRVDTVHVTNVLVRPTLRCAKCVATILARVTVRNFARRATRVKIDASLAGRSLRLGTRKVRAARFSTFEAKIKLRRPRLWSPAHPHRYRARFTVRAGSRKVLGYSLHTGVRALKISRGRLYLNGRPVRLRGTGLHEDDPRVGFAIDSARRRQIVDHAKQIGATVIRAHYPLHPEIHELADRRGLMIWSEIPVYNMKTSQLRGVRGRAVREVEKNVLVNRNHPSVFVWSVGNELSPKPRLVQKGYITRAVRRAKKLDPTRPVGLAINGYPTVGCRAAYGKLDLLGINSYFGWYPGPNNQIADRNLLSGYLDRVRSCYRRKAIIVSEFGAEANRNGPVQEKGTYEFQQDFVRFHLGVYASKPWLSGALYWALQEFRVRPNWAGGNPLPSPPFHKKGLLDFDGARKPAWQDIQQIFKATNQLGR